MKSQGYPPEEQEDTLSAFPSSHHSGYFTVNVWKSVLSVPGGLIKCPWADSYHSSQTWPPRGTWPGRALRRMSLGPGVCPWPVGVPPDFRCPRSRVRLSPRSSLVDFGASASWLPGHGGHPTLPARSGPPLRDTGTLTGARLQLPAP